MLNEVREYEQYSTDIQSKSMKTRLGYRNLIKKDLAGYPRAMEIIARHFLFEESEGMSIAGKVEMTEKILESWNTTKALKTPGTAVEQYPYMEGWLDQYITKNFIEDRVGILENTFPLLESREKVFEEAYKTACMAVRNREIELEYRLDAAKTLKIQCDNYLKQIKVSAEKSDKIEAEQIKYAENVKAAKVMSETAGGIVECLNRLRQANYGRKKELFSTKISGKNANANQNNYHECTYNIIIANACNMGCLKRYYLVGNQDIHENLEKLTLAKTGKMLVKKKKDEYMNSHLDIVLKLTAGFLLEMKQRSRYGESVKAAAFDEENRWASITMTNVSNWASTDPKVENLFLPGTSDGIYQYAGRTLYSRIQIGGNSIAITLDPKWIEECGWRIVEESELTEDMQTDCCFYSDAGSGICLQENELYV